MSPYLETLLSKSGCCVSGRILVLVCVMCHVAINGAEGASWTSFASVPNSLGEVAAARIGGTIYLVGQGISTTFAYSIAGNSWSTSLATRPYPGNHHAAVVPSDGNMWIVGGFGSSSEGKLTCPQIQVYNVGANSWTSFSMPSSYNGPGSLAAVVVSDVIYFCGGIISSQTATTNVCGKYSIAAKAFSSMASLPLGVNHAAYATDGAKIYVLGGRGGSNVPSPGYNAVQIYTISTNSWTSSTTNSAIAPLPQARGGMGTGVYINGDIYVIGGETSASTPTNGVFTNVDIYTPRTNTWRTGTSLPFGMHGIYPVYDGTYIYIAGGGVRAGSSSSNTAIKLQVTLPTTTTTAAPAGKYCPSSGQQYLMLCMDGTGCDVQTAGWGCCSTHGGRKACPQVKPVLCSTKTCGNDYCCDYATSSPLCGGQPVLSPCP